MGNRRNLSSLTFSDPQRVIKFALTADEYNKESLYISPNTFLILSEVTISAGNVRFVLVDIIQRTENEVGLTLILRVMRFYGFHCRFTGHCVTHIARMFESRKRSCVGRYLGSCLVTHMIVSLFWSEKHLKYSSFRST
jgi:hypothetical protein